MAIAKKMKEFTGRGSAIRKMFEEGNRLKALYGADRVFDFSIGNPSLPPPAEFDEALRCIVASNPPGLHAYMPNAGLPQTRAAIAARVAEAQGVQVAAGDVVVTCGAAGGLNIVFKTLLEPGDEVLVSSPYFVEYGYIADNHGGRLVVVPTAPDFELDVEALAAAMNPRTKIVLVNTPNNPSGRIYSADTLSRLGQSMRRRGAEFGHTIYMVSDEPYRALAYDGAAVPSPLAAYADSILVTSYSKDLSLPGERIGYVAVNPAAEARADIMAALILSNRILGYVNAPSLMQHVIARLLSAPGPAARVDVDAYRRKRDLLAAGLEASGYEFVLPGGTFYLFPKIPGGDPAFLDLLKEENILVVDGAAFGTPGHFRISYCVDDSVIERALPGFARAMERHLARRSGPPA